MINAQVNKNGVPFEVINPKPTKELLKNSEGEEILKGKIKTKSYNNMYELLKNLKNNVLI